MRRVISHLSILSGLVILPACSRLSEIPYNPPHTPEAWLSSQPFVAFSNWILVQPSSTVFVYLLGIISIISGIRILKAMNHQQTRKWWGIALLLWGLGALSAGTSYQAFSYEIKCAGRELCSWTSWWEIVYLILSAASVDAMMVAQAYACFKGRWRKSLHIAAVIKFVVYLVVVLIGAFTLNTFLISFELLVLAAGLDIILLLVINGRRYIKHKTEMDRGLLGIWIGLIAVLAVYFAYLLLDITSHLWARGIWFSENDVLHIGLIVWMLYIARVAIHQVKDLKSKKKRH
jgi:hypothetical protein